MDRRGRGLTAGGEARSGLGSRGSRLGDLYQTCHAADRRTEEGGPARLRRMAENKKKGAGR